ncbi:MAG TPA: hypothetical protein VIP77_02945 [Jiangellaceae bacterium]
MRVRTWVVVVVAVSAVGCATAAAAGVLGTGSAVTGARETADTEALDAYARELGLVMIRSRGPEPEAYARMVDGPGPDVETLVASVRDGGGAEVVLRLRQERAEYDWLGGPGTPYEISACYRWRLDGNIDEHLPKRLDGCPDVPVMTLPPAPVEPRLPAQLIEGLESGLAVVAGAPAPQLADVLAAARDSYTAALRAELAAGVVTAEQLLPVDEAVVDSDAAIGDLATGSGTTVGLAVGAGYECVLVLVAPGAVTAWVPDRISLEPGEIACTPGAALTATTANGAALDGAAANDHARVGAALSGATS